MNLTLLVPSIGCASCIETITKTIQANDANAIVAGDAATKSLNIESQLPEAKIRELIAIAGHKVSP
jgi:copper chaperone